MFSSMKIRFGMGAAGLVLALAGCDSYPLAIQNKTNAQILVEYSTKARKCDLAEATPLKLKPGERFAIRCPHNELISLSYSGANAQECILSHDEILRITQEEKGFSGSFLLEIHDCKEMKL